MIKKLISNFMAMFASEILFQLSRMIGVIYMARILGAEGFGSINFSLAVIGYFLIITNLGLGELGVRESSRKKDFRYLADTIISIRTSVAFISFLVIVMTVVLFHNNTKVAPVIAAFSLMLFPYAMSMEWVFRGTEMMKYNAYGKMMNSLFYLGLIVWLVKRPSDMLKVAFISVSAEFIACVYYYVVYNKKFGPVRLNFNIREWTGLLPVSTQLFLSSALLLVYNNFGTLVLGIMKDVYSVGIYGAAYKLISLSYAISYLVVIVTFPAISRLYHEDREKFKKLIKYCAKFTMLFGIPIGIVGTILGPRIIDLLYGNAYKAAGPLFQIMCWFIAINATSYTLSYSLIACDKQGIYLKILGMAVIFNVAFNLIFVPFAGYYASAFAIVCSELVVLAMSLAVMSKIANLDYMPLIKKPIVASLIMGVLIACLFKFNIFILLLAAPIFYFAVLMLIGGFPKYEMSKLKESFV